MSNNTTTVSGLVATTPRHIVTQDGVPITSFRIAVEITTNSSKYAVTSWYTVMAYNALAINIATSISKGDRVVVFGELAVRDWDNGERAGTSVEIIAIHAGHDLSWGSSVFTRTTFTKEDN